MDEKELNFDYDQESDVLYCSFGRPVRAIGHEIAEGVVIRVDETTNKVVGITLTDFSRRFTHSQSWSVPVAVEAHELCAAAG